MSLFPPARYRSRAGNVNEREKRREVEVRIYEVYTHTPRPESRPRALPSGPGAADGSREQEMVYTSSSYPLQSPERTEAFDQPAPKYS